MYLQKKISFILFQFFFTDDEDFETMFDWLIKTYGCKVLSVRDIKKLSAKLDHALMLVNQMRASGHDIDDDYMVNLEISELIN